MSKTWSWEQFSADFAGDDDCKDLSSVSSSFRQLLGELASQHMHELAELQKEVAVQNRRAEAWREQLERGGKKWPDPAPSQVQNQVIPAPVRETYQYQPEQRESRQQAHEEEEPGRRRGSARHTKPRVSVSKEAIMLEAVPGQIEDEEEDETDTLWGKVSHFMKSGQCEMLIGALILMNVITMSFQLQYEGFDRGRRIGYRDFDHRAEDVWPGGTMAFLVLEGTFTILFAMELVLRALVLRWNFVKVAWNWLDLFVVVTSLMQLAWDGMLNTTVLRLLRIAKLGRGARVVRMSTMLDSLSMILKCITASFSTLFWSLFLLLVIQCIGAMSLMYGLESYFDDVNADPDERLTVFKYFGTFTRTMLTMFEILFANWIPPCRILVDLVSEWFSIVFIMYRCLVGFAVLNVVNAVFVQQTMKVAQNDQAFVIMQKQKAMTALTKKLKLLFQELDTSGDGLLTWSEFSVVLTDEAMSALLSSMEIETQDLRTLFELLDSGDGVIDADEFASGVLAIKGPAKSLDVAQLKHVTRDIDKKLDKLLKDDTGTCQSRKPVSHETLPTPKTPPLPG